MTTAQGSERGGRKWPIVGIKQAGYRVSDLLYGMALDNTTVLPAYAYDVVAFSG